jgi:hypothetical protein
MPDVIAGIVAWAERQRRRGQVHWAPGAWTPFSNALRNPGVHRPPCSGGRRYAPAAERRARRADGGGVSRRRTNTGARSPRKNRSSSTRPLLTIGFFPEVSIFGRAVITYEISMHEHLWAGVERKLQDAQFSLDEMGKSLQPPERPHMNVVQQSTGAIIDTRWQDSFYAHVDTFLAKVRSVPGVIESCFGADCGSRPMKVWFDALPFAEQTRRQTFSDQFQTDREAFGKHYLTKARNISEHRLGFPGVEGKVVGPFGDVHVATPVKRIPTAESRRFGDPGNDPALQWTATQPPQSVQPRWDQFSIDGKPLFPECRAYLALVQQLVEQARGISHRVHGTDSLTTPPSS